MLPARRSLFVIKLLLAIVLFDVYLARTPEPERMLVRESSCASISSSPAPLDTARDRLVGSLLNAEMLSVDHRPRGDDLGALRWATQAWWTQLPVLTGAASALKSRRLPTARHLGPLMLCVWLI